MVGRAVENIWRIIGHRVGVRTWNVRPQGEMKDRARKGTKDRSHEEG